MLKRRLILFAFSFLLALPSPGQAPPNPSVGHVTDVFLCVDLSTSFVSPSSISDRGAYRRFLLETFNGIVAGIGSAPRLHLVFLADRATLRSNVNAEDLSLVAGDDRLLLTTLDPQTHDKPSAMADFLGMRTLKEGIGDDKSNFGALADTLRRATTGVGQVAVVLLTDGDPDPPIHGTHPFANLTSDTSIWRFLVLVPRNVGRLTGSLPEKWKSVCNLSLVEYSSGIEAEQSVRTYLKPSVLYDPLPAERATLDGSEIKFFVDWAEHIWLGPDVEVQLLTADVCPGPDPENCVFHKEFERDKAGISQWTREHTIGLGSAGAKRVTALLDSGRRVAYLHLRYSSVLTCLNRASLTGNSVLARTTLLLTVKQEDWGFLAEGIDLGVPQREGELRTRLEIDIPSDFFETPEFRPRHGDVVVFRPHVEPIGSALPRFEFSWAVPQRSEAGASVGTDNGESIIYADPAHLANGRRITVELKLQPKDFSLGQEFFDFAMYIKAQLCPKAGAQGPKCETRFKSGKNIRPKDRESTTFRVAIVDGRQMFVLHNWVIFLIIVLAVAGTSTLLGSRRQGPRYCHRFMAWLFFGLTLLQPLMFHLPNRDMRFLVLVFVAVGVCIGNYFVLSRFLFRDSCGTHRKWSIALCFATASNCILGVLLTYVLGARGLWPARLEIVIMWGFLNCMLLTCLAGWIRTRPASSSASSAPWVTLMQFLFCISTAVCPLVGFEFAIGPWLSYFIMFGDLFLRGMDWRTTRLGTATP